MPPVTSTAWLYALAGWGASLALISRFCIWFLRRPQCLGRPSRWAVSLFNWVANRGDIFRSRVERAEARLSDAHRIVSTFQNSANPSLLLSSKSDRRLLWSADCRSTRNPQILRHTSGKAPSPHGRRRRLQRCRATHLQMPKKRLEHSHALHGFLVVAFLVLTRAGIQPAYAGQ
jgi:hypothetical protein